MSLPNSLSSLVADHCTLEVSCIDRVYMNVYVPTLQREPCIVGFFCSYKGAKFASSALMEPISKAFIGAIEKFTAANSVPLITFASGQRKDDVAKQYLVDFTGAEGVLFVGKAQEKTPVFRTISKRNPVTGNSYPWLIRSKAMVNHYYFYCVDRDFGPFFLKYGSYFPYNAKLCINGHEYVKRQLGKEGIQFQALDNGIASCDNPARLQQICDSLSADKIEALLAKWQHILPIPFTEEDRTAGYDYAISVLQIELSLTQVLDKPDYGRIYFEQAIRENLDIGRPDNVQLIFDRRINKRTPGRFRTRIVTKDVIPSLHVDYKNTRIKQYHKEGRALRTETTINNTRDFEIGKRLTNANLAALRQIGFRANQRLLDVQRLSFNPAVGEEAIQTMQKPLVVNGVRTSAMPFADDHAQALLQCLSQYRLHPNGFANKELRKCLAPLLAKHPDEITQGQMTYDLRRLRLRQIIERIPKTHRYRVTDKGLRIALFYTHVYSRTLRPGLSAALTADLDQKQSLVRAFNSLQKAMDNHCAKFKLAA